MKIVPFSLLNINSAQLMINGPNEWHIAFCLLKEFSDINIYTAVSSNAILTL